MQKTTQNIHQLISFDDPLYAVSGTRGFFTLGEEVKHTNSNPKYGGLRPLIDKIPDQVIKDFQDVAIQYSIPLIITSTTYELRHTHDKSIIF